MYYIFVHHIDIIEERHIYILDIKYIAKCIVGLLLDY